MQVMPLVPCILACLRRENTRLAKERKQERFRAHHVLDSDPPVPSGADKVMEILRYTGSSTDDACACRNQDMQQS
jgi:hypothetical protein